MTHDPSHDAETDVVGAELEAAGLVTVETRADGEVAYTLTPTGEQLARQMAMSAEDDAAALLERCWTLGRPALDLLAEVGPLFRTCPIGDLKRPRTL